jgi:hypothetical protein
MGDINYDFGFTSVFDAHRGVRDTVDCCAHRLRSGISVGSTFVLISVILIPGWEVREATIGLSANDGVNVSLLFSAVHLIVDTFGGLLWI